VGEDFWIRHALSGEAFPVGRTLTDRDSRLEQESTMNERGRDPEYSPDEIEAEDPLGERGFENSGFADAPDGGPQIDAEGIEMPRERAKARPSQKVSGVPKREQHESTTPSLDRPETDGAVIRERGGSAKGDPAVGGTRPD
jgi:hypothetical protein